MIVIEETYSITYNVNIVNYKNGLIYTINKFFGGNGAKNSADKIIFSDKPFLGLMASLISKTTLSKI